MTAVLEPTTEGLDQEPAAPVDAQSARLRDYFRGPGWPLAWLLVGYPVWWLLGLAPVVWVVFAIPMLVTLLRRRPIRFPPMFWVWGLFLLVVVVSGLMINVNAPDTQPLTGSGTGRLLSYGLRLANYLAVTVILLFVGNLRERELPRLRVIRMFGVLFLTTVVGGWIGTVRPGLNFPSPMELVLPKSILANDFVTQLVHVDFSQQQDVLQAPRPSAPFEYANSWGNNFAILVVWFVLGWLVVGSTRRRIAAMPILLLSVVPAVYSQNRGMWIAFGLSAVYVAVRLAMRGRLLAVGAVVASMFLVVAMLIGTPLRDVVSNRLATPRSNDIRASLAVQSVDLARSAPLVGYGSIRYTVGSGKSLAIGKTPDCPRCGNRAIGSTGQITLLLVSQGFLGALLYTLFFLQAAIRYRKDHSPLGIAGSLVVLLSLFFLGFYGALVSPLALSILAVGMLWRNAQTRAGEVVP